MDKKIARNSLFNMVYRGFITLFPLITTAYTARVLMPQSVGLVAYANAIVTYFVTFAYLGLPSYGVKTIGQNQSSPEGRSKAFCELFTINFISTSVCILAYYLLVNHLPYFSDKKLLFNVMGIALILNICNIDWFYQGIEEYSYIATRSVIVKIISFGLILVFVKKPEDYVKYALILCIAIAGNYILNTFRAVRYIKIDRYKLNIRQHLKPVFILLASSIATEIHTILDTVMIEFFHGEISVGYYSNAVKIVRMVYSLAIAAVATFCPKISLYIKLGDKTNLNKLLSQGTKFIVLLGLPSAVGLMTASDYIVYVLFGPDFEAVGLTLRILSPLVMIFSIAYFLGQIILIALGKEKVILLSIIVGIIINFSLNWILIPFFDQNGAAIASVIAELSVMIIQVIAAVKQYKLKITRHFWLSEAAALIVMVLLVEALKLILPLSFIGFLLLVSTAVLSYFAALLFLKNEVVLVGVRKIAQVKMR